MSNDVTLNGLQAVAPVSAKSSVQRTLESPESKDISPKTVTQPASPVALARDELERSVGKLNSLVQDLHRELRFAVDDQSGETVVKVFNKQTDELVRQIPSEEMLRIRERLQESTGKLFDATV